MELTIPSQGPISTFFSLASFFTGTFKDIQNVLAIKMANQHRYLMFTYLVKQLMRHQDIQDNWISRNLQNNDMMVSYAYF